MSIVNPSCSKQWVTFHHSVKNSQSSLNETNDPSTPLEAAITLSQNYIVMLHSGVTTFLTNLSEQCLKEYAEFFYTNEKNREMHLDTAPVPKSVKKIKLTLYPLEEVRESKGYTALQAWIIAETEALHQNWAENYAKVVNTWNCNARLRRFQKTVCMLLQSAAIAFSAQLDLLDNLEDEIVMNLLVTSGVDNP